MPLRHAAFDASSSAASRAPDPGTRPLDSARLTDRGRLGVLFQGAAILAHLEAEEMRLASGWEGAGLTRDGALALPLPVLGASALRPEEALRDLAARLFGGEELHGRSEARRIARGLIGKWRQSLVSRSAEELALEILAAAPFLWHSAHSVSRRALAAEAASGEARLLGPGPFRRRVRRAAGTDAGRRELEEVLAGPGARDLWRAAAGEASRGARTAARIIPSAAELPRSREGRLRWARELFDAGRFESALAAAKGLPGAPARLLRLHCQNRLGRLGKARAALRRLAGAELEPGERIELAEIAVRMLANRGELAAAADHVAAAHRAAEDAPATERSVLRARAHLLAAAAAWDRGDGEEMERHLESSRQAALGRPELAWRWRGRRASALRAAGDPEAAARSLASALGGSRRRLRPFEAAELWNELGIVRAGLGDLAAAERAFRHTVRLLGRCEGPRRTNLALANLAEIRLRRGRLEGVGEILRQVTTANRLAGNLRAQIQDAELEARYELALGRPAAALERCRAALAQLEAEGMTWRREVLLLLTARALGWLGRRDEAAAALDEGEIVPGSPVLDELEVEERPALFALAGRLAEARRVALGLARSEPAGEAEERSPGSPAEAARRWSGRAWTAILDGASLSAAELRNRPAGLGRYRTARLVYDVERLVRSGAGAASASSPFPAPFRRRAADELRRMGASALADALVAAEEGPWTALADYLEVEPTLEGFRRLLARAGYEGADLRLLPGGPSGEIADRESPVLLRATLEEGELRLTGAPADHSADAEAMGEDRVLRALFALARRDIGSFFPSAGRSGAAAAAGGGEGSGDGSAVRDGGTIRHRGGIVGRAPALVAALDRIDLLAAGGLPILILGESGTGKELAARRAHHMSSNHSAPHDTGSRNMSAHSKETFVAFNCAAVSENLLLADLFGHVRGAFTGADRDRAGIFETARGGTVFLDEIGDLPAAAQGMLLRVLQEGEVRRVGESLPRKVDVQVVAATHRNLAAMVEEGSFRQDLYFRLKVVSVDLPPLRERGDDVTLLARFFLDRIARKVGEVSLSAAAEERLVRHGWPGNVRELENVLRVAAALAAGDGRRIEPRHLDLPEPPGVRAGGEPAGSYHGQVEELRRRLIEEALKDAEGQQARAARRLGLSRQALSYLVRHFKLL